MVREDNMEAVEDCLRRQGKILAPVEEDLRLEVEAQTLGASSVLGWGLVKFKEGSGLLGNPMVPLEPKDVRLLEHACAQQGRDEFSARQAMARARDGRDGRRPGERRDWQEVGDRRGKTRDRLEDEDARPGEGGFLERVRPDFNGKCFGCGKEGHQVYCCPEKDRAGRRWVRASREEENEASVGWATSLFVSTLIINKRVLRLGLWWL